MKTSPNVILIVFLLSLPQLSPLARPPQRAGGASLSGIVVRSGTDEPLAGAQAVLTAVTPSPASGNAAAVLTGDVDSLPSIEAMASVSATPNASRKITPVSTDRDGKFVFQNLAPGLYSLQVIRNEYAREIYGQRVAGGPALAIRLSEGQLLNNIVMALVPAGSVTGVIRDSDGHPQTGVPIQLLRATRHRGFVREREEVNSPRLTESPVRRPNLRVPGWSPANTGWCHPG
jgi:hypothetical protein